MIKKLRRRITILFTALTSGILIALLSVSLWYSMYQTKLTNTELFSSDSGYIALSISERTLSNTTWLTDMEKNNGYIISLEENGESVDFVPGWQPVSSRDEVLGTALQLVEHNTISYYVSSASLIDAISIRATTLITGSEAFIFQTNEYVEPTYDTRLAIGAEPAYIEENGETYAVDVSFNLVEAVNSPYLTFTDSSGEQYRVNSLEFNDENNETYSLTVIQNLKGEQRDLILLVSGYIALMLLGIVLLTFVSWLLSKLIVKPTEYGIKRQTEFVAAASHELRSPLTVLRSSIAATQIAEDKQELEKYLKTADLEAERMGRLIEDLLLLAGSDSKKWRIGSEQVDIDTLLIETAEQYEALAKSKGIAVKLELPESVIGEIRGDKNRLRQILSVLMDNALEYGGKDSTITLGAKNKKNRICLSVSDEGEGIPDELKDKIFDRFYRADESRSNKTHFGLGLSVAKELAELSGGFLTVEDNKAGGAKFTLHLGKKNQLSQ